MKRGFPRLTVFLDDPKVESRWGAKWNKRRYPWPYTASSDYIGNSDDAGRPEACIKEKRCGMCGTKIDDANVHLIISLDPTDDYIWVESGPFHQKCVSLVLNLCPAMTEQKVKDKAGNEIKKYDHAYAEWQDIKAMMRSMT